MRVMIVPFWVVLDDEFDLQDSWLLPGRTSTPSNEPQLWIPEGQTDLMTHGHGTGLSLEYDVREFHLRVFCVE